MDDIWIVDEACEDKTVLARKLHHDYYDKDHYECGLCRSGFIYNNDTFRANHEKGLEHQHKAEELLTKRSARYKRFIASDRLRIRMRRFGSPESMKTLLWQNAVEKSSSTVIDRAARMCVRYEKKEPLVMLELALWKACCFLNPPRDPNEGMDYYLHGGWKRAKANNRSDPLIGSVMVNVLPFLGMGSKKVKVSRAVPTKRRKTEAS
jgi:hypothetical protein